MTYHVKRLHATAIKGLRIESPATLDLTSLGARSDRTFYLVDENRRLVNGRRCGELATANAHYAPDTKWLRVAIPGGPEVSATANRLGENVATWFYNHTVYGRLVDGPWGEALSSLASRKLSLVKTVGDSLGVDLYPITIISTATIDEISTMLTLPTAMDHRCYRMTIEIGGCGPYEEETWLGRRLYIGDVTIRLVELIPRCVVVQQDPSDGKSSAKTLTFLSARRTELTRTSRSSPSREPLVGVYGVVETPGTVHTGCPVVVGY